MHIRMQQRVTGYQAHMRARLRGNIKVSRIRYFRVMFVSYKVSHNHWYMVVIYLISSWVAF